jgi:hypothetical protein
MKSCLRANAVSGIKRYESSDIPEQNRKARPIFWTFDRTDRLSELIDQARRLEEYLLRSACDVPLPSLA